MKCKVTRLGGSTTHVIELDDQSDILSQLLELKIPVDHSCGGSGTCGTCQFECLSGLERLSPPNELEAEFWSDRGYDPKCRLGCQTLIKNQQQEPEFLSDLHILLR